MNHLLLATTIAFAAGCSFDPGMASVNKDMSAGGGDLAGITDMTPAGTDLTMVCTPGDSTCAAGMLSVCNADGTGFDTSTCEIGCNTAGVACLALQPTAPAVAGDFVYAGLKEPTIAASQTLLVFDVDSGEIKDGGGASVRMPNADPMARNVENGIGFHVASGVGVWTFAKLTLPATATIVFKHSAAAAGAAILSATDLTIAGTIDARGYTDPTQALMATSTLCTGTVAGPGGTIGASGATAATGTGAGGSSDVTAGGGGGGYGAAGGIGGNHGGTPGGIAGTTAGAAAINPLLAGFGGGCSGTAGTTNGGGGGGGGALQLAAEGTITVSGGINAGGCGGAAGAAAHGGGGGGSGGAILIEAPTVHVTATGILAANGGGGGAGGDAASTAGTPGKTSEDPASGGMTGSAGGAGGALGAEAGLPGTGGNGAGGGGGGVGRVRLNSKSGAALDTNSTVSPAATQATVVLQ
ncbi:MAG TPA: hypothetical protein VGL86_29650 [Polyangia bacterium]